MSRPCKVSPIKLAYIQRYNLTKKQSKDLTKERIEQLERCKDEAARRLLLGRSA